MAVRDASHSRDLVPAASTVYRLTAGPTARDLAAILFRRKRIITTLFASIVAAGLAAGAWLRPYVDPPRYTAGLKLILKRDRVDALVTPSDRSVPGISSAVTPQEIHSEIELLKSSDVVERLSADLRNLIVEPVTAGRNLTNLIAVRYVSTNAAEVARVMQKLPEVYLEKHLSVNARPEALEYFRSQAESFDQRLHEAEEELAEFQKDQPPLALEHNRAADFEKQRLEAEAAIRETESRVAELKRQLDAVPAVTSTTRVAAEPAHAARLKAQLLDLENQRARTRLFREIDELDRRIAEIRQAIAVEGAGSPVEEKAPNLLRPPIEGELLRNEVLLAGLRARRAGLADQERRGRERLSAARLIAAENAVEFADLGRKVKIAEENALFYRRKYAEAREADLLDQKRVLNVAVAEGPRPPVRVERRHTWTYMAILVLVAGGCSMAGGLAAEALDHSVHTPRELEACSSLAVLACLPDSKAV